VKVIGKSMNAHMLVYIHDTAIDEVLAPLTQEDVPPHLCKPALGWQPKNSGSFPF